MFVCKTLHDSVRWDVRILFVKLKNWVQNIHLHAVTRQACKRQFGSIISWRCLHFSSLTLADEKRATGQLVTGFVRQIDYGRDFEQQLNFYVEARASFCNLDSVLVCLVQVNYVIFIAVPLVWLSADSAANTSVTGLALTALQCCIQCFTFNLPQCQLNIPVLLAWLSVNCSC